MPDATQNQIDSDRSARGLDDCPACRYSLRGLPMRHRCPECGWEFDEHSHVWRARPRVLRVVLAWSFLIWMGVPHIGELLIYLGLPRVAEATLIFATLCLIAMVISGIHAYRQRPFIATGPAGASFRRGGRTIRVIPWNDLVRVTTRLPTGFRDEKELYVTVRSEPREVSLSDTFSGVGVADRIAAALLESRDRAVVRADTMPAASTPIETPTPAPTEPNPVHAGRSCETIEADRMRRGLEACPVCGYALRGLPEAHRCPECFFEFDGHSHVWLAPSWRWQFWLAIFGSIYLGWCVFSGPLMAAGSPLARFSAILIAVAVLAPVFWFRSLVSRRRFVAAMPRGVMHRLRSAKPEIVPWDDVAVVIATLPEGGTRDEKYVHLLRRSTAFPVDLSAVVIGIGAADRLTATLMELRMHYLSDGAARSGATADSRSPASPAEPPLESHTTDPQPAGQADGE